MVLHSAQASKTEPSVVATQNCWTKDNICTRTTDICLNCTVTEFQVWAVRCQSHRGAWGLVTEMHCTKLGGGRSHGVKGGLGQRVNGLTQCNQGWAFSHQRFSNRKVTLSDLFEKNTSDNSETVNWVRERQGIRGRSCKRQIRVWTWPWRWDRREDIKNLEKIHVWNSRNGDWWLNKNTKYGVCHCFGTQVEKPGNQPALWHAGRLPVTCWSSSVRIKHNQCLC